MYAYFICEGKAGGSTMIVHPGPIIVGVKIEPLFPVEPLLSLLPTSKNQGLLPLERPYRRRPGTSYWDVFRTLRVCI